MICPKMGVTLNFNWSDFAQKFTFEKKQTNDVDIDYCLDILEGF